jgi:hypothetical protein
MIVAGTGDFDMVSGELGKQAVGSVARRGLPRKGVRFLLQVVAARGGRHVGAEFQI